jgi:hypothetical protein
LGHAATPWTGRISKGRDTMVKHRMAFGAAAIAAVVSMPAFAGNLVTNGGFENNFGAGQLNQTLPGSAGGQNASHPGTTAGGWTGAPALEPIFNIVDNAQPWTLSR